MTNAQIFTAAHKLAKTFQGNYSACLSLALRNIYATLKSTAYSKNGNFDISDEEKELNMGLSRTELFAKYGFEPILVGVKTTLGNTRMAIKVIFGGFKMMFQGRESFFNWTAKVGLIPSKYLNCFPKNTNDTYITGLIPGF